MADKKTSKKPDGKNTKKVADIRPPEPSASSRPIIVTNHSLARDPMLSGSEVEENASAEPPLASHGKTIMPLSDNEKPAADTEDDESASDVTSSAPTASELVEKLEARKKAGSQPDEEASTSVSEPSDDASASDTNQPAKSSDETASLGSQSDSAADDTKNSEAKPDSDSGETSSGDDKSEKPASKPKVDIEAEAKRQAELDELTISGKYFLPINQVQRRHDRWLLTILIIILLIIVLVDLLYDSGILKSSSFTFHTHFFHR